MGKSDSVPAKELAATLNVMDGNSNKLVYGKDYTAAVTDNSNTHVGTAHLTLTGVAGSNYSSDIIPGAARCIR